MNSRVECYQQHYKDELFLHPDREGLYTHVTDYAPVNTDVTCVRTSSGKAVRALDVPDVDCSTTPAVRHPRHPHLPPLTSCPITYRAQYLRS